MDQLVGQFNSLNAAILLPLVDFCNVNANKNILMLIVMLILIYLLAAIGLSPGGSSKVQYTFTHKQYVEQHKYKLMWKSADRAPSLRVLPWHLPYN